MTKSQQQALQWLRERNGTGCFDKNGVLLAAGELAPVMRSTWNALEREGMVRIGGKRVTVIEKETTNVS